MSQIELGASYFGVRNPDYAREDLEEMRKIGCDFVVHTFSENDFTFYQKTMKQIANISHELGMEVWVDPWGVGGVFGGEAFSDFLVRNTRSRQVYSDGGLAPGACLQDQKFKDWMKEWVEAAANLGADVIFWDEPHLEKTNYPQSRKEENLWACHCEKCKKEFKNQFGYSLPQEENEDTLVFEAGSIFSFLQGLMKVVKKHSMKNALCLLPKWEDRKKTKKWERYLQLDTLDIFGTDPYWLLFAGKIADLKFYVEEVKELTREYRKKSQIWIQAFQIPEGKEDTVRQSVEVAHQGGIENIAAWSYKATAYMSYLKPDNPGIVWEELKKAFREIRNQC